MIDTVRRLSRGYRLLFLGMMRFVAALTILAAVSVGISLPLWFLAHNVPRLFDFTVLAVGLAIFLILVVRKIRQPQAPRRGTDTFSPLSRTILGLVILGSVVSFGIGYGIVGVIGVVTVSGFLAWRIVPR
jgi:hypothetical protein